MTMRFAALLSVLVLVLAACTTPPPPLQGSYAEIAPNQGAAPELLGTPVRWGGVILAVESGDRATCFQVLGRPLGEDARPLPVDRVNGRFLACRDGFYDPELFTSGREITVVGRIAGESDRPVGDFQYRHPVVEAERLFLWPLRPQVVASPWY